MASKELKWGGKLGKRTISAVILISLAIIFLPMLFERVSQKVYLATIPEAPRVNQNKPIITISDFTTLKLDVERSVPTTEAMAWKVQIGQFSDHARANRLLKRLRQDGYRAYVEQTADNNKYTVSIGPETDKAILQHCLASLKKQNIEGQMVVYKP